MKIKSKVKAGSQGTQHNQTIVRGMKIKTRVKAGGTINHNQTLVRGMKIRTRVKAGMWEGQHNQTIVHIRTTKSAPAR